MFFFASLHDDLGGVDKSMQSTYQSTWRAARGDARDNKQVRSSQVKYKGHCVPGSFLQVKYKEHLVSGSFGLCQFVGVLYRYMSIDVSYI